VLYKLQCNRNDSQRLFMYETTQGCEASSRNHQFKIECYVVSANLPRLSAGKQKILNPARDGLSSIARRANP